MEQLTRTIYPEIRVEDSKRGIVRYIASDQSIDSYGEVIRARGWRFSRFAKNAPFIDSHRHNSIASVLGKVIEAKVEGDQLINVVQWAIGAGNDLAELGWRMTQSGFLRAVSVGFYPVRLLEPGSSGFREALNSLGIREENAPRRIYVEQEQIELSAVVIGANPNAVAEARSAGVITDTEASFLSSGSSLRQRGVGASDFLAEVERITAPKAVTVPFEPSTQPSMRTNPSSSKGVFLERLTRTLNGRGDSSDLESQLRDFLRTAGTDRKRSAEDLKRRFSENPEAHLAINAMIRRLTKSPLSEEQREYLKTRAMGEDSGPGNSLITDDLGRDLYDILAVSGAWATLGVRPIRSRSGKFPITTAVPNAQFISEAAPMSDATAMTGSSTTAQTGVCGVLLNCSEQLIQDVEEDLVPDFLEKFDRSFNNRIDHATFVGDGTDDGNNGGMTGLFNVGTIPVVNAAATHTTVATLVFNDFVAVLEAAPAGVLQRRPSWWMNPTLLAKAMRIRESGESIVRTSLEFGGETTFSILGFPVRLVATAPSTDAAAAKVAVFGEPGGYLVALRQEFQLEFSSEYRWNTYERSYRGTGRVRGQIREANAFVMLKTAAA
jgi:HK97 family phage major capsid protein